MFRFFCNILWENIIELFDQPINRSERLIQIIDATVVQLRNEQLRVGQDLIGLKMKVLNAFRWGNMSNNIKTAQQIVLLAGKLRSREVRNSEKKVYCIPIEQ